MRRVALAVAGARGSCRRRRRRRAAHHAPRVAAPDGTAWAHLLRDWAREIEASTNGAVRVKLYFSGIAGDEIEDARAHPPRAARRRRLGRHRLRAARRRRCACMRLAGVFQSREEAAYVIGAAAPDDRARRRRAPASRCSSTSGLGPEVLFTRTPVRSLAELRKHAAVALGRRRRRASPRRTRWA